MTSPGDVSSAEVEAAFPLSTSRAPDVATLGERLATVQLLRDVLYCACETYANGTITPTTYGLLVSRIDKLLAALMAAEVRTDASSSNGAEGTPAAP